MKNKLPKHLAELLTLSEKLEFNNLEQLDELRNKTKLLIEATFKSPERYLSELNKIDFQPLTFGEDIERDKSNWEKGEQTFKKFLNKLNQSLVYSKDISSSTFKLDTNKKPNNLKRKKIKKVFVVHGHDNQKKLEVTRFIENDLKKKAIILHEQPNKGRTIIEKFEDYADVDYAVAIWSADDKGSTSRSKKINKRARQNVVFETGFFIGKIGRNRVAILYEEGVEIPSDYDGVIFIKLNGNWKDDLRIEIFAT